jgi:hypothetical protein
LTWEKLQKPNLIAILKFATATTMTQDITPCSQIWVADNVMQTRLLAKALGHYPAFLGII